MTIGSKKAWLVFIWTVGLSFACYNFIHEFYEFQKVKQAASDNLTTSMEAFSVISQKKSRSLLQRMEVNNKLLAKHPDLVQRSLREIRLVKINLISFKRRWQLAKVESLWSQIKKVKSFMLLRIILTYFRVPL